MARVAPSKKNAIPAWLDLAGKLPTQPDQKQQRRKLFNLFDPNGNGYLSLAEVDRGLIITFQLDGGSEFATKRCKPAILRAFQAAKTANGTETGAAGDYVTRGEFRLLLVYLQRYFELLAVFDEVDTGNDRRVDLSEFKKALPKLSEWGVEVADPEAEFASIDKDGGGQLLFDEFSGWAIQRGLDMLDDGEVEGQDTLAKQHVGSAEALKRAALLKEEDTDDGLEEDGGSGGIPPWVTLAAQLPTGKAEKAERRKLFNLFDPNGNGYLSLAEVDRGLIITFQLDGGSEFATKRCKPAIIRAFQAAKTASGTETGHAGDYVTRSEFRLLLVYLQRYFELLAVFDEVDTGNDRRVDLSEFKKALPKLSEWGVKVADPAAEFASIDKDGGGQLLFDEFSGWAIQRGLDMLDDGEVEGQDTLAKQHVGSAEEARRAARAKADAEENDDKAAQPADGSGGGLPSWIKLCQKLPTAKGEKAERKKLFNLFDPNGNGYLSLAEVDRGLIITFQLNGGSEFATKRCKPAIMRAFQAAKTASGTTTGHAGDYVTKGEFRLLLVYLQRYFELLGGRVRRGGHGE